MRRTLPCLAVLLFHSAAFAQQPGPPPPQPAEPPPAQPGQPQEYPPGYGPPPGYGQQPPQGYGQPPQGYGQPPPRYYPPPPPPPPARGVRRGLTLGGGIGFGRLAAVDANNFTWSDQGLSYSLRVGVGIAPNLVLMWNLEGTSVTLFDPASYPEQWDQTAHLAALQFFFLDRFWIKGGIGGAHVDTETPFAFYQGEWGMAAMAGAGYELIQGRHTSFDIEVSSTIARYPALGETWSNTGLNFAFNWY